MGHDNKATQVQGWESPVAIHPGEYILDFLEEFSMTQDELAKRVDLTPKTINEIIKGKANITKHTALKLSKVFPVSENFWNNLQELYFADIARIEDAKKVQREVNNYLTDYIETYKELAKHCLVEKLSVAKKNHEAIVRYLHGYFGTDTLAFVEHEFNTGTAFRKYSQRNINLRTVAAWIRAGERKAIKVKTKPFDLKKLKESIPTIRSLSTKKQHEYLPELEAILSESGVVLVYMPYFSKTYAQGAVRWMSKDKVLLMLKSTHQSEDKFWFNLFHELGHIIKHNKINKDDKSRLYLDLDDLADNEIEREANEFAQNTLVPDFQERYQRLFNDYRDYRKGIIELSKESGITPSIFAGQIAHLHQERGDNVYHILSEFWKDKTINYTNLMDV